MVFRKSLLLLVIAFALLTHSSAFVGHRHFPVSTTTTTALASSSSSTEKKVMPEVKVGDAIPDVTMMELVTGAERPVEIKLQDLLKGKKVAIFGVPGAVSLL